MVLLCLIRIRIDERNIRLNSWLLSDYYELYCHHTVDSSSHPAMASIILVVEELEWCLHCLTRVDDGVVLLEIRYELLDLVIDGIYGSQSCSNEMGTRGKPSCPSHGASCHSKQWQTPQYIRKLKHNHCGIKVTAETNQGYINSLIPLRMKIHCIEPADLK